MLPSARVNSNVIKQHVLDPLHLHSMISFTHGRHEFSKIANFNDTFMLHFDILIFKKLMFVVKEPFTGTISQSLLPCAVLGIFTFRCYIV